MSSNHRLVQRIGLAIAAAGVVAGAAVWFTARGADDSDVDPLAQQRVSRTVERLGGKATVQTVRFNDWLGSLWQGQRLGLTLAVLGLVIGGACRHVGGLMQEDDLDV